MIHILQSVSNMDRGGIESMLMNYYRHLDRTQFQFDFLVNKKKPGFFDDEIRALGGRIFQSPGVAPQSYPAYLRSMQQLLAQHPEIKVLHAHNEAMQLFALEGAKKAGLPVRIAHAHNTRLPKDAKLPIKWFCKQFIPGAATDYWACGREAGIYYFGQSAWDARGVTLRNAIDLDHEGNDVAVIATGLETAGANAAGKIVPKMQYQNMGTVPRPTAPVTPRPAAQAGYTAPVQPNPAPAFSGIQKPRQPESSVQQMDIKIPDFLKNSRR